MKNIIYIVAALIAGLALGYILFRGNEPEAHVHAPVETAEGETIWTCSMHPQIRQPEPGLCPICEMDLIPLDNQASSDPMVLEMTTEAVRLMDIQTTTVGAADGKGAKILRLNGKIKTDERRAAMQVAHVPGRIEQLFVTFTGERVRKGQRLATIYSPDLISAQRELIEAAKMQDISPELLAAARQKLAYWRIPAATIDRIIENGQIQETFTVSADFSGVVTERMIAVGDYVQRGEPLFAITDLSRLWIELDAYEEDLAEVAVGDRITFTTPGVPGEVFSTRITYIDPLIDPQTRTAVVRAEVNNTNGRLKPEMLVRAQLQTQLERPGDEVLSVPKSAVMWTGKRSVVYVRIPDTAIPSFEFREVVLGEVSGDNYLILEGLAPGEEVVTNGAFTIDAAAQLNNNRSMMNRKVNMPGQDMVVMEKPDFSESVDGAFQRQLTEAVAQYVALKDVLVSSDAKAASAEAAGLIKALSAVDVMLLTGEARDYWARQVDGMQDHTARIQQLTELEEQRAQFDYLSRLMVPTVQAFGVAGRKVYVQHCPMANDNNGADWLSYEDQIRNPYFGDRMLKCGMVTDTIAAD